MKTMSDYTISCTPEQTKKALELGAPIKSSNNVFFEGFDLIDHNENYSYRKYAIIPTAEEMIGWLEEQGQSIEVSRLYRGNPDWSVFINDTQIVGLYYSIRKKAILAGIDMVLDYLLTQK